MALHLLIDIALQLGMRALQQTPVKRPPTGKRLSIREQSLAGRYDWVLFDQGGTLFEPLPAYTTERNQRMAVSELGAEQVARSARLRAVFLQARQETDARFRSRSTYTHQQLVTEHLLRGLIGLGLCDIRLLNYAGRTQFLPAPIAAVAQRYFARQRDSVVTELRLKPGCHNMLTTVAKQARLAIASNNSEEYLQPLVARYAIDRYMHAILSSDALGVCKPDPRFFSRTFERLGISNGAASRVLYVGDSPEFDVACAAAAGLDVVLLDSNKLAWPHRQEFSPTYQVGSLFELETRFSSP